MASQSTLFLDEVDTWAHTDCFKGVLNAGFERNTAVVRMQEVDGKFVPEKLAVFGPKALAGIGINILSVPTRDRTFMFEMVRQTKGERRERLNARQIQPEADLLKEKILKWSEANKARIRELYDKAELAIPYLNDFSDRTIDITLPLAAVVEAAYLNSPRLENARLRLQEAISLTRNEQQSRTELHKVIGQLIEIGRYTEEDPVLGNPKELSDQFATLLKDTVLPETISAVLRQYGFKQKSCRKEGGEPRHRYELPMGKLEDLFRRYGTEYRPAPKLATHVPKWFSSQAPKPDPEDVVGVVGNREGTGVDNMKRECDCE